MHVHVHVFWLVCLTVEALCIGVPCVCLQFQECYTVYPHKSCDLTCPIRVELSTSHDSLAPEGPMTGNDQPGGMCPHVYPGMQPVLT